ncbi:MAG: helix-turn-helix domain-containing protein [Proteobacteria bacterium]|nr:helix-turn-helix domain-containing protein [Pseudomonadota bacterium]MBS0462236.1 helix-turn-helix domain-containing protein [Pseudomonadota bacterium]MBS0465344.1 helix-turn-helix domain-containing protein [Pseudomonadota bacterium]
MLDLQTSIEESPHPAAVGEHPQGGSAGYPGLEALVAGLPLRRRTLKAREYLFRAGQPRSALYLVHAGFFKTCVTSVDGREKITSFRLRGDLLGIDALDMPMHACDAIALDTCEVWELPCEQLRHSLPQFQERLTAALAAEIRRDWGWMLALGTLSAEQRVIAFLLDFAARLQALGFSATDLMLRMTRAEVGNFLSLKLETVTRALSRLQARGLLAVDGRQIRLRDAAALREVMAA